MTHHDHTTDPGHCGDCGVAIDDANHGACDGNAYDDAADRTVTVNKARKNSDGEYRVTVTVNGRIDHGRTYFTEDKADAEGTRRAMIQEARDKGENVTNDAGLCGCGSRRYCAVCAQPDPNTTTTTNTTN